MNRLHQKWTAESIQESIQEDELYGNKAKRW